MGRKQPFKEGRTGEGVIKRFSKAGDLSLALIYNRSSSARRLADANTKR
jgi:hypothetical protein